MKKTLITMLVLATALTGVAAKTESAKPEKLPVGDREPVLMLGDSMMRLLGKALEKELKKAGFEASAFSSLGSGLARLDAFDWYAKIDSIMEEKKPATVIVTLGANDRQTLRDDNGNLLQFGTEEWRAEYSQRIGRAMDDLINKGARQVIWLKLPDMQEHVHQGYADLANILYEEQAATDSRKDKIRLFDIRPVLSRTPGKYTAFLMSPQGESLTVRDPDGVHLTNVGAKLVAEKIVEIFWKK